MSFIYAMIALLVGTAAGYLVQRVATALRYNGLWPQTPGWKKEALSATGSIAAFVAGAYILANTTDFTPETLLARLWLWQTIAAWGGATVLDLALEWLKRGGKR